MSFLHTGRKLLVAAALLFPPLAFADSTRLPASGSTQVVSIHLRNAGVNPWALTEQGLIFQTDNSATFTVGDCGPTNLFFIPKKDPANPTADNPLYKDYVALVITASTLASAVAVHVEGCVTQAQPSTEFFKVVGIVVTP